MNNNLEAPRIVIVGVERDSGKMCILSDKEGFVREFNSLGQANKHMAIHELGENANCSWWPATLQQLVVPRVP